MIAVHKHEVNRGPSGSRFIVEGPGITNKLMDAIDLTIRYPSADEHVPEDFRVLNRNLDDSRS
jgi:hypothetical protein